MASWGAGHGAHLAAWSRRHRSRSSALSTCAKPYLAGFFRTLTHGQIEVAQLSSEPQPVQPKASAGAPDVEEGALDPRNALLEAGDHRLGHFRADRCSQQSAPS